MSLFTLIAFAFLCAALYYLCPDRFKWMLLLLASYAYYAYCGANALPFILLTTLSTWAGALCIGRIGEQSKAVLKARRAELDSAGKKALKAQAKRRQRAVFFAVLLLNFGVLALLKYTSPLLTAMGRPALNLLLPLGISFYTFQSMGYLIDVYNGKYAPQRNPAKFALFISFFPQLIQGPIARFDQLAAQLETPHRFDIANIERGALLMLWGFFKKKVIADRALPLVSAVFGRQEAYGGAVIVVAVLLYSLQQYCDFSGGIDLVTGIAELFGIRLAPNFRRPYFSVSLGDFWRRWHISLGAWMRDYVFYPFALTRPMTKLSRAAKARLGADVSRALPAALTDLVLVVGVMLFYLAFHIREEMLSTICTGIMGVVGLLMVYQTSQPFNKLRKAMMIGLTAVFALCYFFLPNLFTLSALDNPSLLILVVLGLLAFSVMFVCRKGLNAAKARLSQGRRPLRRRKREDGGQ